MKSDTKLISAAYAEMMQNPEKYACMTRIKDLMCFHGFGNICRDQSVVNGKLFLANFEQSLKDTHIQKCIGDMNSRTNVERTEKLQLFTSVKLIWIAILDMI